MPMLFRISRKSLILLVLLLTSVSALAQERTVGVMVNADGAYDGYALFVTIGDTSVYLMNNDGRIIHTWNIEETPGVAEAHLLENGNLMVVAGARDAVDTSLMPNLNRPNGSIQEYTWDGELVWEHQFIGAETHQHHAIDIMPDGSILVIAWDYHSLDEALAMGLDTHFVNTEFRDHRYLLPDIIIEIDPSTDEWIWQWDAWDHLAQDFDPGLPNYGVIAEHPQRIDINYQSYFLKGTTSRNEKGAGDWMHSNSVNYHPELDQIVLSVRSFDEFWIIDHSLSAAEAAGSAGDLLYRWGNPFAYMRKMGGISLEERQLFAQHDVQWIAAGLPGAGNILLFNNRNQIDTDEEHSSIMELKLPLRSDGSYDWSQEAEIVWSYAADGFHSNYVSGVQRLPNGNTLITEGAHGRLIEVRPDGEVVWEFVNPKTRNGLIRQGDPPNPEGIDFYDRNLLFRVHKYPLDYPGFEGKDMTPGRDHLVD